MLWRWHRRAAQLAIGLNSTFEASGKLKEGKKPFRDLIMALDYPGGGRVFKPAATNALNDLRDWSASENKRIGDGRWDN